MKGLNQNYFIGTLGKDAEVKTLEDGRAVVSFSIAVNEQYTNKLGDKIESTEWINIEAWDGLATILGNYGKKGTNLHVSAKFKNVSYEKDGVKIYSYKFIAKEIILLSPANTSTANAETSDAATATATPAAKATTAKQTVASASDDVPF